LITLFVRESRLNPIKSTTNVDATRSTTPDLVPEKSSQSVSNDHRVGTTVPRQLQTKNIWRSGPDGGSQSEMDVDPDVRGGNSVTFSDEDIEVASRIANGVSNVRNSGTVLCLTYWLVEL